MTHKLHHILLLLTALLISADLSGCVALKKHPAHAGSAATTVSAPAPLPSPMTGQASVEGFIDEMVAKHGFQRADLVALFDKVQPRERIIRIMTTPAEGKPWNAYRPIFVNEARIRGGVDFWHTNSDALARAERQYGVPAEIITAIIGVETRYGGNMGSFNVIDALATLAFDYPPRADYFRSELEQFLLLTREEHLDPLMPKGSYAGAMGEAQFMPSSYRHYSIDFDGDGHRDLWHSTSDAIGSVANYLSAYGWQRGQPIATPAQVTGNDYQSVLDEKPVQPIHTIAEFRTHGVHALARLRDDQTATLLRFKTDSGDEFWLGLDNFYVITRYNHSHRYAMAVYQLSQEILARHQHLVNGPE